MKQLGAVVRKISLGTLAMAAAVFSLPSLAVLDVAPAFAQDSSNLKQIKEENARLREELAELRERDRLGAEISTVRSRVERQDSTTPAAPVPTAVRKAYAADKPVYK